MTRRFRFVPGTWTGPGRAIACDGRVPGAALELSHWEGNATPEALRRDTSTGIALAFVSSKAASVWDDATVVNNHFDTDGLLSVWTLLDPEAALARASLLVAAAEAGDFDAWPEDVRGLWIEMAVDKLAEPAASDAEAYALLLALLPGLVDGIEGRSDLWGDAWGDLRRADDRIGSGAIAIERFGEVGLVVHPPGEPEIPGPLVDRELHACRGVVLAFDQGDGHFAYRYERPRWTWAETVVRPHIDGPDGALLSRTLGSDWTALDVAGMTGLVRTVRPIADEPASVAWDLGAIDVA